MTPGLIPVAGGALAVMGSWVMYMATVPSGRVPARPVGHMVAQGLGTAAVVVGITQAISGGASATLIALSMGSLPLVMGPLFFFLLSQRKTPVGKITVGVGDRLPAFAAVESTGEPFESQSLAGQRVLFKFFRGHW